MTDLDLTPREPAAGSTRSRTAGVRNLAIVVLVLAVLGFVLFQALTSARVFFYNVDEAVALRAETGEQVIRMQGTVLEDRGVDTDGALQFTMAFAGVTTDVSHNGDEPSNLFAIGEKVVVEGQWDGTTFVSHQILVKHSEEYVEDNGERLEYEVELPDDR